MKRKDSEQERRKSNVRIWITYGAGLYIFIGSIILMLYGILCKADYDSENFRLLKDIFMLVLPVATGIITYWFSARSNKVKASIPNSNNESEKRVPSHDSSRQGN